ncbi:hypothetical protein NDU88_004309 [Pleurodeles waltl]|uniref:Uncharacterized protein n=1 Tax=Pleurodeles waltl TaxID=8319 RepID=A0AAV7W7S3_PLEWA|nr:hypothetical protein NDU88_004309 [Pleurodeles waltl]
MCAVGPSAVLYVAETLETSREMPTGKLHGKPVSKSMRELLFLETLKQPCTMAAARGMPPPDHSSTRSGSAQDIAMERILQEMKAVGHRLEGLGHNISAQEADPKSIHLDIVGFQNQVTDLEQRISPEEG